MALTAAIDLTVKKPDFKSMKQEIRELTIAAQQAVMEFGEFSPEAIRAEQALAQARDRMDDFNDRVAAVNPDKFAQINTVVQGVARGFQAAQGAMALFGNESEELQKTMVKLQGAMALAEGLEGLGKVQQQFGALANTIKGGVIQAFQSLGKISSLAFGVLGIALTLIITNFDKIKNAILGLIPGLKTFANFIGNLVQKFTDFVGITSAAERALDKFNKTTDKNNQQLDREIALLQARGDQIGVFNKQRQKLENELAQARANYGKNNKENWGKIILDTKNALQILAIEEQNYNNEQIKIRNAANKKREDERQAELKHQKELQDSLLKIKQQGIEKDIDAVKFGVDTTVKLDEQTYQKQYTNSEKLKLFVKANQDELIQSSMQYFNTISELADAFAGRDEESQRRAFQIGKAMRYASTVLSTIEGTQNAFTTAQGSPITALFPPYPYVQATAAALFGVAQLAMIKKTQFKTTSAPSPTQMSGGGLAQMSAPQVSSRLPEVSGFEQKVFVTEGDITRTQARVENTKRVSVVK